MLPSDGGSIRASPSFGANHAASLFIQLLAFGEQALQDSFEQRDKLLEVVNIVGNLRFVSMVAQSGRSSGLTHDLLHPAPQLSQFLSRDACRSIRPGA